MIKITQIKSNHWLLLFFVLAFLTMQWSTTHIHLATQHHHNGKHHHHTIKTHAHQLAYFSASNPHQHADTFDLPSYFFHPADHANTIDIKVDYNVQKQTPQKIFSDVITGSTTSLPPSLLYLSTSHFTPPLAQHSYLEHSTVNPRAPPQKYYFL
jgi:hypothetical protein